MKAVAAAGAVLLGCVGLAACSGSPTPSFATPTVSSATPVAVVTATVTQTVTSTPTAAASSAVPTTTVTASDKPTPSPSRTAATRTAPTTRAVAPYVDPVAVVQKFYSDLNSKNFRAAWNAGGYNFTNGGDYKSWVAGYADTTGVIGTARDIGGSQVSTEFSAVHVDGSVVRYAGTYMVRGAIIVSGHLHRVK